MHILKTITFRTRILTTLTLLVLLLIATIGYASWTTNWITNQAISEIQNNSQTLFEQSASAEQAVFALTQKLDYTQYTFMAIMLAGLLITATAFFIINSLFNRFKAAESAVSKIATGGLNDPIVSTKKDEIGLFLVHIEKMRCTIEETIGHIESNAVTLNTATAKLASIEQEASVSIKHQFSEIDQVATAMNEMTATVQEVARNASEAADAAGRADEESSAGHSEVDKTISTISSLAGDIAHASDSIRQLKQDSEDIGSILDVIKTIAEQTNLLALNAAIEAARAGEQGRGFAVVADEVRTLATRTQDSTKEIERMIERLQTDARTSYEVMDRSKESVQQCIEQASKAGSSLSTITSMISTINQMNTQIAAASDEQRSVSEEINRNIVSIREEAENSAGRASNLTETSQLLAQQAEQLVRLSDDFKQQ